MATRKRWSRSVGAPHSARVRVYERKPGGALYVAVWVPRRGVSRRTLGHTDRKRALQQAGELALLRAAGEVDERKPVTLGALCERYLREMSHARDGSLKTEGYRRDCARRAKHLLRFFGPNTEVRLLTPDRMQGYVQARRAGEVSGRAVRTRSVQCDLVFLKTLLRWASGLFEDGQPLLERNPLTTYSPPRERDPRRPMIDGATIAKLMAVADRVHPQLSLLIVLMETTGRRLRSVLGLRWDDFDFEHETIHWRPELDKRRRSWLVPMPSRAADALLTFRAESPQIGSALVFPAPRRIGEPVSVSVAEHWLLRAYALAGLTKLRGGLWHPFRRKWATERKPYPLRDVAAAGGWSDVQTLLICYQQPDAETLKAVIEGPKLAQQLTQVI